LGINRGSNRSGKTEINRGFVPQPSHQNAAFSAASRRTDPNHARLSKARREQLTPDHQWRRRNPSPRAEGHGLDPRCGAASTPSTDNDRDERFPPPRQEEGPGEEEEEEEAGEERRSAGWGAVGSRQFQRSPLSLPLCLLSLSLSRQVQKSDAFISLSLSNVTAQSAAQRHGGRRKHNESSKALIIL